MHIIWTTAGVIRTCPRCLEINGKIIGFTDEVGVQLPPLHPRCRCAIIYREISNRPGRGFEFDIQRFGGQKLPEGEYNLKIRENAQARHIEGTKEYAAYVEKATGTGFVPSKLSANVDAPALVKEFHGKGIYDPNPRDGSARERVDTGRIIGQYWDKDSEKFMDTTWLEIVYSKKGTHIYPNRPLKEG